VRLYARFAALYGWLPNVRGFSRGELELGLMANMVQIKSLSNLGMTEGIAAALNGDSLAALMERAGMPEKEILKVKMESIKNETMQDAQQWHGMG